MLATRGTTVPAGEHWAHEVKWDGVRVLADSAAGTDGGVRLSSRTERDITVAWPDVALPVGRDLLVDGEVIALGGRGTPDFRALGERLHVARAAAAARLAQRVPATFMVFDLLRLDGRDLRDLPWSQRRALLEDLAGSTLAAVGWQVPATYDDGATLHEATLAQGLEGVVSKRRDARYATGARSPHWVKLAHRHRGSYVVGGWRVQEGTGTSPGSPGRLAALLVGEPTADGLAYRGRVGSGIGARASRVLAAAVEPLARADSPFADAVPPADARGTRWVEPVLVVDVDTHGLGYRRLRQPSLQGLREDLVAEDLAPADGRPAR